MKSFTHPDAGNTKSRHPGFKNVAHSIARKENISQQEAAAILAARTRNASPQAKKANPRLRRVK